MRTREEYRLQQNVHRFMEFEDFRWYDYSICNPTEYGLVKKFGVIEITLGECNLVNDRSLGLRL